MASKFVLLCSLVAVANAGVLSPIRYTATPAVAVAHKVAYANPAVDAVASTHQNVVRSFDGTVSTHSKAIDTPYSSVRKTDTRISNNVYSPALQKTVTYAAAPAHVEVANTVSYAAAPVVERKTIAYAAPVPAVTKTLTYAAPVVEKPSFVSYSAPAITKTVVAPVVSKTVYTPAVAAPSAAYYSSPVVHNTNLYTNAYPKAAVASYPTAVVTKPVAAYASVDSTTYNHGPAATTYTHNAPGVSAYGSSQTVHYSPAEMVSHMSFDGFGTHWGF